MTGYIQDTHLRFMDTFRIHFHVFFNISCILSLLSHCAGIIAKKIFCFGVYEIFIAKCICYLYQFFIYFRFVLEFYFSIT